LRGILERMSTPRELQEARAEAQAEAEPAPLDAARVEEAFAAFSDRVRELEEVAGELKAELRALRSARAVPPPVAPADPERWPVDGEEPGSPEWIAAVPAPLVRPSRVPRLALEGLFLLLVALLAGLADLAVPWIVLVMVTAWALVVLGEWAAAARRARWRLDEVAPALGEAGAAPSPWDVPVVEATVVEAGSELEEHTVVTRLPAPEEPPADEEEEPPPAAAEAASEEEKEEEAAPGAEDGPVPGRLRRLLRRRAPAETAPADPWEQ
jgi:hypothetical protein